LPLLKTLAIWLVVLLAVFFALLLLFNYMSSKGRKKIQKEVKDDLHRRNREEYERYKKEKDSASNNSAVDH
jgi:preprotein translocase subunit SecG